MMRAGTQTGSLINHLMSREASKVPAVGDGATMLGWTDRHAATVVEVSASGKKVVVQQDHAKRIDNNGMSESQSYEYSPNPNGSRDVYTLRKDGSYTRRGDTLGGRQLLIGHREEYYDYSF